MQSGTCVEQVQLRDTWVVSIKDASFKWSMRFSKLHFAEVGMIEEVL